MSKKKTSKVVKNIYPYIHLKAGNYLKYKLNYPGNKGNKENRLPDFDVYLSNTILGKKYFNNQAGLEKEAAQMQSLLNYFYSKDRNKNNFEAIEKTFEGKIKKEVIDEIAEKMEEQINKQVQRWFGSDAYFDMSSGKSKFHSQDNEAQKRAEKIMEENNQISKKLSAYANRGYTILQKCDMDLQAEFSTLINKGVVSKKDILALEGKIKHYEEQQQKILEEAKVVSDLSTGEKIKNFTTKLGGLNVTAFDRFDNFATFQKGQEPKEKLRDKLDRLKDEHDQLIFLIKDYIYRAPARVLDWQIGEGIGAVIADIVGSPPQTANEISEYMITTLLPQYAREGGAKVIGKDTMNVSKYGGIMSALRGAKNTTNIITYKDNMKNTFEMDVSNIAKLDRDFNLREKVDVSYQHGIGSGINIKHYNLQPKSPNAKGVSFVSESPLLYMLQDNSNQEMLFHAINILAEHPDYTGEDEIILAKQNLLRSIRLSLIYKAISGDTYSGKGERKLADMFLIKDTSQPSGVLVMPTIKFLNKIAQDNNIIKNAIYINNKIMDDNYAIPNKRVEENGTSNNAQDAVTRMVQTLMNAHQEKVSVKISNDFIRNMI